MTNNIKHNFLTGGGEMAELIQTKDWSKTSLGALDTWPQSLRTALSILLNSKIPMFLCWGSDLSYFHNDAYRPILETNEKNQPVLGAKAEVALSSTWPIVHPFFKYVLDGKGATWNENQLIQIYRKGKKEELYWTFGYSPVYDELGKISGVMAICNETTENVVALKKLEECNKRYLSNIIKAPTAMCVFRGENHILEIANAEMLELWGKTAEELLNKPIFEALPEAKNQGLEELIHTVYTTGEKFVAIERPIQLPRNGKINTIFVNFTYEAIKEADGSISGVVAIAVEVTPKVIATSKMEENEQKIRAIIENSPFPIAVYTGKEMIVEMANETIINMWGKGNQVIGKSFKEVLPEFTNQLVFEQIKTVYETGQSYHTKNTPLDLTIDGKLRTFYFNYSLTPLYDINCTIYGVMNTGVDVTDLILAKKKIEESDKRFRNTVKQAPVGITILRGKDHIVEMANEAYLKLVDKEESFLIGKPLFDSLPEAKEAVGSLLDNVLLTGIPFHGNELPVQINRYGNIRLLYFDFLYHPLEEENGAISGIIVTVTDVTEKVESRKITEQNEERLNIIVEASELGTWELNLKTREPLYSKRYIEIIGGYTDELELSQQQLLQHLHPEDFHIRESAYRASLISNNLNYEARVIWKDKSVHWIEIKGKIFYDTKNLPEKLLGTARDITKEKTFANELEKQVKKRTRELSIINESLEKSEERYHLMVDEIQDYAILYLNQEGIVENWNAGAQKIKGYKAEEIIGKNFSIFYTESDRKNNLPQKLLNIAKEKGKSVQEGWRIRKNGTLFWANVVITAVYNTKKQLVGFSKITHDLTEKKKADDKLKMNGLELQQKNLELEKMNKELHSFAYISSHDLQEPLRKIQTFATQIIEKESKNLSDSGKDKFRRMQNAAQRMQALINDLLAYSKTNIQDVKFEKTNLSLIIQEVKDDLEEELHQKNARIITDAVCDEIIVAIIPFQFRQILYNLLSNSIKFSRKEIPLEIVIKCEINKGHTFKNKKLFAEGDYCHLEISDNGIGFEQEYGEKIFEVFQRLHGKTEYVGTGIGLAIVKKIVDNHHGFITATGDLSKGATFNIYIPVV